MTDAENRFEQIVNEDVEARKTNFVAMVLDRSSSMHSIRDEAVGAFNEQIRTIREATEGQNIDVVVGLVTFSNRVDEPVFWNLPLHDVPELRPEDYIPSGMTAMRDGVGFTIDRLKEFSNINDEDTSVLVVVISDGHENNSREYSSEMLANRIKECQDTGRWTFVYEGANQDLSVVSAETNIPTLNTLSFDASASGMGQSRGIRRLATNRYYRSCAVGATQSRNFYDRKADQVGETTVTTGTTAAVDSLTTKDNTGE